MTLSAYRPGTPYHCPATVPFFGDHAEAMTADETEQEARHVADALARFRAALDGLTPAEQLAALHLALAQAKRAAGIGDGDAD